MKPGLKQQLLEALKQTAQALAWDAFGECRGYHDRLPHPTEALALAREAIAALEDDIAQGVAPVARLARWMSGGDLGAPERVIYSVKVLDAGRALPMGDFLLYTTPQEPAPRTPYGWQVQGLRDTFKGEFAETDAKAEAKRVGGTAYAFPIYIDPPI